MPQNNSNEARKDSIPFYWKTTCHTCRSVKTELENRGINIKPIDIMKKPPPRRILKELISHYGAPNMIRRNSKDYKELGVGKMKKNLSQDRLVTLLHSHPDLAMRPILITKNGAILSKDETLYSILDGN